MWPAYEIIKDYSCSNARIYPMPGINLSSKILAILFADERECKHKADRANKAANYTNCEDRPRASSLDFNRQNNHVRRQKAVTVEPCQTMLLVYRISPEPSSFEKRNEKSDIPTIKSPIFAAYPTSSLAKICHDMYRSRLSTNGRVNCLINYTY